MEREQLEVDVLFVGAGPANLGAALHLSRLIREHNQAVERGPGDLAPIEDPTILVIEKGREIGAHSLSGAVVNPRAFDELLEGFPGRQPPYDCAVADDALYILTQRRAFRAPITPPPLRNHGFQVASLGKLVRWMAELCEENGIEVYPEFPAVGLLFDGDRVTGVRIGDKGVDKDGRPKPNFEPGIDVLAKVTVLGEGVRGSLFKQAEAKLPLNQGKQPQIYAAGAKEVWEVPGPLKAGQVFHTMGFPLGTRDFGGGFIYTMNDNVVSVGFVLGLDYHDPAQDFHGLLQQLKTHPFVTEILQGGKLLSYGAKAIPEGGYYAMPRCYGDGFLVVGDSGGFLDAQRLKGVHLAIKSGMLAAETIRDGLVRDDFSAEILKGMEERFTRSWVRDELWKVRNFRQSFQRGFWSGFFHTGLQFVTGGRGLIDPMPIRLGHTMLKKLPQSRPTTAADGPLVFDKLKDVFHSDTAHEEDQPCHLHIEDYDICNNRCTREFGNPCQHFCPAAVYEMVEAGAGQRLQVNFTNCVHCKTCDIMDPYQIITWTPPEGGGGPDWKLL